jgi:hypothetical protein
MQWMNQIGGLLQQYGGANPNQPRDTVEDDFDQVTQAAPPNMVSQGLAEAFRSDQTPPFNQMVTQLFNNSNNQQRASILNTLIAAAGPMVLQHVMSRMGSGGQGTGQQSSGGGGGLGSLIGLIGGGGGSGQPHITPEQAARIPPEAVQEIAREAENQDPSVIDRISDFYSEHPTLVKTLGAAALTIALMKVAQYQNR